MSDAPTLLRFSMAAVLATASLAGAESPELRVLARDAPVVPLSPSQDVRVLLLPPATGRGVALPEEATRAFRQAIVESTDGVVFVSTLMEATDLLQLTNYQLTFDERGVSQTWEFSFRPLVGPDDPPAARARPGSFGVSVQGRTLGECTRASQDKLSGTLRSLLARFRPVVPR